MALLKRRCSKEFNHTDASGPKWEAMVVIRSWAGICWVLMYLSAMANHPIMSSPVNRGKSTLGGSIRVVNCWV